MKETEVGRIAVTIKEIVEQLMPMSMTELKEFAPLWKDAVRDQGGNERLISFTDDLIQIVIQKKGIDQ